MTFFEQLRTHPTSQRIIAPLDRLGAKLSEDHLMRIDWRVLSLMMICALLFAVNVTLKTSGSSVKQWNSFVKGDTASQTSIGSPRFIRFDEWGMATPLTLSQVRHGFTAENPALGAGKSALLMSLPVKSFPSILRPQLLGYFIFDLEHAYSFTWNYKVYGMFLAVFFLLYLLTRNNFWLSVSGAVWLCYSSFVQWWYSTPEPEMIMSVSLVFLFFVYLCYSQRTLIIILSGLGLALYAVTFALFFYPPHQIPLAYLMLAILIAYMIQRHQGSLMKRLLPLRALAVVAVLALLGVSLMSFLDQAKDTITIMTQTEYPGNRISTGGEIPLARFFGGYWDCFFSELHYPQAWENVCEASNFVLLFPVVIVGMLLARRQGTRFDVMDILLVAYILFLACWMLVGYPELVAKLTVLNRVKENRAFIGIGFASVVLVITYMSRVQAEAAPTPTTQPTQEAQKKRKKKNSSETFLQPSALARSLHLTAQNLGVTALMFAMFFALGFAANAATSSFLSTAQIIIASLFFAVLSHLVLVRQQIIFGTLIVLFVVLNNFMVNPVFVGLSPILDKELMTKITEVRDKDPHAKWMFYGTNIVANYFIAAGVDCICGTKFAPDLAMMKIFDPEGKNKSIYNRFAQIRCMPNNEAKSQNDVSFHLDNYDGYSMFVNPCADQLREVGVKYFVSAFLPTHADLQCFEPVQDKPIGKLWMYKRRDTPVREQKNVLTGLTSIDNSQRFAVADIKILTNETNDTFIVTGMAADAVARTLAGGVVIEVDGQMFEGTYGIDNPKAADPRFRKSAFRVELPYARIGKGHTEFKLHLLTLDRSAFMTSSERFGVDVEG